VTSVRALGNIMASFELYSIWPENSLEDGVNESNDSRNTVHRQFVEDELNRVNETCYLCKAIYNISEVFWCNVVGLCRQRFIFSMKELNHIIDVKKRCNLL